MSIILRNDDILLDSSSNKYKDKEFERFRFVHEQILRTDGKMIHHPAIVCTELNKFPECIEYIKKESEQGRMFPCLHGWDHDVDWTKKSVIEITDMLDKCEDWFIKNFDFEFLIWATPWGAYSRHAEEAAESLGFRLQTTKMTKDIKVAAEMIKTQGVDILADKVILYHWWQRGLSLFRIIDSLVYGSWEEAKVNTENPEWFKE